eukprot:1155229-Pelagomonas_calceolata.AAC.9
MVTKRHKIASRTSRKDCFLLEGVSKSPLRACLASMDIGSADPLALQILQVPEHSTNRTLPELNFPCRFPDKQRLTSSRPDAILIVPINRATETDSWYPLRSRGGRGGNSAPAAATLPASKVRHPS